MLILREESDYGILYDTETLKFSMVPAGHWPAHDRFIGRAEPVISRIPAAPVRVYVELTKRCNLACKHCFVSASPKASFGMNTAQWEMLIDEMHEINVLDLRFTGGEVTTRPDWYHLVSKAKNLGFSVSLNTNGVYEDVNETVEKLAQLHLEQVTVSLDGLETTHDKIRGGGNFRRSMESLQLMHQAGVKTRVNCVLTMAATSEVPALLDAVSDFVEEINFFFMRPVGRARSIINQMVQMDDYLASAATTLNSAVKYPRVRVMHQEQAIQERSLYLPGAEASQPGPSELPSCITTMNISSDGRFWPHGYNTYQFEGLSFGRFPQDRLSDSWRTSPRIQRFRDWQTKLLDRCRQCSHYLTKCPGSNIEMEISVQMGVIPSNPYCISDAPVPRLQLLYPNTADY